jgi:hypothetical protein
MHEVRVKTNLKFTREINSYNMLGTSVRGIHSLETECLRTNQKDDNI